MVIYKFIGLPTFFQNLSWSWRGFVKLQSHLLHRVLCTILVHSANCSCPTLQGVTFTELEHTTGADPDCYAIIDTPMTWDEANAHCKSIHSLLLAIDRSGEAEKIAEHLISAGCK